VLHLLPDDKAHLKIPNATKEHLKSAALQVEERLREEQKMVRSQKRLVKVQEMMSSEEEKKKQRHKMVRTSLIEFFLL
jgi:PX domain-containing protein kinase-like protein